MLRDDVRSRASRLGYSPKTAKAYWYWIRRFILFHGKRHPRELGVEAVTAFLAHLSVEVEVSASTHNQALSGLLFLYREVFGLDVPELEELERTKGLRGLPVVLSRGEVDRVSARLHGDAWLQVSLLYGAGLRLEECLSLRVKDIDFDRQQIVVRRGKGGKDRTTMLPVAVRAPLAAHLGRVSRQHERDPEDGAGCVELRYALSRKLPGTERSWVWQWVFPAARRYRDRDTGEERRHHVHPTTLQRAVKHAAREAGVQKDVSPHVFRHCFATHLLERGVSIRKIQELMGTPTCPPR
jgi:integron integrase